MTISHKVFSLTYKKSVNRIDLYDFYRGLAMLLVLLQHAECPGWGYLLSFHMPLFFFLSGLVTGDRTLPSFKNYFQIRFKRIMVPYFFFGLFDIFVYYFIGLIQGKPYDVINAFCGVILGQYGFVPHPETGIYWFLYVAFVAELMTYPFQRLIAKYKKYMPFVYSAGIVFFIALSYITTHYYPIPSFSIDKAFIASSFILLGRFSIRLRMYLMNNNIKWRDIIILLLGSVGVYFATVNNSQPVLMYINQYGDYHFFLLGSIMGILATLVSGKFLYILLLNYFNIIYKTILWMGFNSLVLFPVHLEIKYYFGKIISHFNYHSWFLLFMIMFLFSIPISNIITNYMPFVLGIKSPKNHNDN